jgi:excisionase family DNA binding protein
MLGDATEAEWLEIVKEVLMEKTVFSVKEVAELLGVNEETIRRAIRNKNLKAAQFGGKHYKISRTDLSAYYRRLGGGSLFGDDAISPNTENVPNREDDGA